MVGLGGLEKFEDARHHASGNEVDTFALAADKMTDDEAETAGVHIGNFGEVEDVNRRLVVRRIGLEDVA